MTLRYFKGLAIAFLVFAAFFAVSVAPVVLKTGDPRRIAGLVGACVAFAAPMLSLLALLVGPIVLLARHYFGRELTAGRAAILGAISGPFSLLAVAVVFREANDHPADVVMFWARVPEEFFLGVLPHTVAGATFAGWLAAKHPEPERIIERSAQA